MLNLSTKVQQLQSLLEKKFAPLHLKLVDKSHVHEGHAGNTGGGHYDLDMVSPLFEGKSLLERHRMVYEAFSMPRPDIHALHMKLKSPLVWKA